MKIMCLSRGSCILYHNKQYSSILFIKCSNHLKNFESLDDCFFLLLRCFRRPAALTLWQVIVLSLDNPVLSLGLRDIQVCHIESVLLLYPLLDLLVCSALPKPGHVHVFEREFNSDILTRYVSLGKLDNRLDVQRQQLVVTICCCRR